MNTVESECSFSTVDKRIKTFLSTVNFEKPNALAVFLMKKYHSQMKDKLTVLFKKFEIRIDFDFKWMHRAKTVIIKVLVKEMSNFALEFCQVSK